MMASMRIRTLPVLLLISLLLVIPRVHAQMSSTPEQRSAFSIGATGGIQFTNVQNLQFPLNYEAHGGIGFTAGLAAAYSLSPSLKIIANLLYDSRAFNLFHQGPEYTSDSSGTIKSFLYAYDTDYRLNYLTIPVGILFEKGSRKFRVRLQANFFYSLYIGSALKGTEMYYFDPAQGIDLTGTILNQGYNRFELDGTTEGISRKNILSGYAEDLETWNFNSYDAGFNIMLGAAYGISESIDIFLDLGFSYSIAPLLEDPSYDTEWSQITRISAGVSYTLGKD